MKKNHFLCIISLTAFLLFILAPLNSVEASGSGDSSTEEEADGEGGGGGSGIETCYSHVTFVLGAADILYKCKSDGGCATRVGIVDPAADKGTCRRKKN